jgi:hypothetical protein
MSTTSIVQRPVPMIAAAAAVAAVAAGSLVLSLAHDTDRPAAPSGPAPASVQQTTSGAHAFQPTTSGGRVVLGE